MWDFKNDHRNVTVDDDGGIDDSPSKQDRRMLIAQEQMQERTPSISHYKF